MKQEENSIQDSLSSLSLDPAVFVHTVRFVLHSDNFSGNWGGVVGSVPSNAIWVKSVPNEV